MSLQQQQQQVQSAYADIMPTLLQVLHDHTFVVCLFCFLFLCLLAQLLGYLVAAPFKALGVWIHVVQQRRTSTEQATATLQATVEHLTRDVQAIRAISDNIVVATTTGMLKNNDTLMTQYVNVLQEASQGIVNANAQLARELDHGYGPSGAGVRNRYFYVGYIYTIDHDHSAKEFQIPGLETIATGVVTRSAFTVVEAGNGIFMPLLIRQLLMQRHATQLLEPQGNADALCLHYDGGATAVGNIRPDGNVDVSDVLDVVINCIQELAPIEFETYKSQVEQFRIQGINNKQ